MPCVFVQPIHWILYVTTPGLVNTIETWCHATTELGMHFLSLAGRLVLGGHMYVLVGLVWGMTNGAHSQQMF